MKTDRELLELAAKAVGYDTSHKWNSQRMDMDPPVIALCIPGVSTGWNPLADDGDALRLAVKAGMRVYVYSGGGDDYTCVATDELSVTQATIKVMHDEDSLSATRRAIVRAAAEIGESMQ